MVGIIRPPFDVDERNMLGSTEIMDTFDLLVAASRYGASDLLDYGEVINCPITVVVVGKVGRTRNYKSFIHIVLRGGVIADCRLSHSLYLGIIAVYIGP